jgi:hypothetical protein
VVEEVDLYWKTAVDLDQAHQKTYDRCMAVCNVKDMISGPEN